MCGIAGIVGVYYDLGYTLAEANMAKGRDGYGSVCNGVIHKTPGEAVDLSNTDDGFIHSAHWARRTRALINCRAEPTTERIRQPTPDDQQPYVSGRWTVVHNGTIANDKDLLKKYDLTPPTRIDSWVIAGILNSLDKRGIGPADAFEQVIGELKGSWAILATYDSAVERIYFATNYRPLYIGTTGEAAYMTSVGIGGRDILVDPYTYGWFDRYGNITSRETRPHVVTPKTLVVLSGGLDSTVVAATLVAEGHNIELLHFDYGCRATGPEGVAVRAIAEHLGVPLRIISTDIFRTIGNSRLLDPNASIATGEAGAEQAIEWVPARNTIMASIAIGIAEAHGFDHIALGINLEEAGGGYTDNVQNLYDGLNGLMHWIIGVDKRLSFISPLGSMMKHEIVAQGLKVNAPMHLSWSCYNAIPTNNEYRHCGNCGPCHMRKIAFEINGSTDPVFECAEA